MKIEERLERVRSILEKNNMLEGLQVFSDKHFTVYSQVAQLSGQ